MRVTSVSYTQLLSTNFAGSKLRANGGLLCNITSPLLTYSTCAYASCACATKDPSCANADFAVPMPPVLCNQTPRLAPCPLQAAAELDASTKLPADAAAQQDCAQLVVGSLDVNQGAVLPAEDLVGRLPAVSTTAALNGLSSSNLILSHADAPG